MKRRGNWQQIGNSRRHATLEPWHLIRSLEEALAALRRDPSRAVWATANELTVELRAAAPPPAEPTQTLGEPLRGVIWHGDGSLAELLTFFAHAPQEGGAGDVREL